MTNSAAKVLHDFEPRGFYKAGELLLSPADAVRLINALARAGVVIYGVDCWYRVGDTMAESLYGLDNERSQDVVANAARAKSFIEAELPAAVASNRAQNIEFVSLVFDPGAAR